MGHTHAMRGYLMSREEVLRRLAEHKADLEALDVLTVSIFGSFARDEARVVGVSTARRSAAPGDVRDGRPGEEGTPCRPIRRD